MQKFLLTACLLCFASAFDIQTRTFRAAVYEHNVTLPSQTTSSVPRTKALENMMVNLQAYKHQTEMAKMQGADIIVFPEDGIYGMQFSTRSSVFPYLEFIPDPKTEKWNPCTDPNVHTNTEVQQFLSCLARNNSIYVVANFGDKQPCNHLRDKKCPVDRRYQYNTDIVYDPSGLMLTKYHKINLFYETQFDFPSNYDVATFDTPFGRFGVFTCFDILFKHPMHELIVELGIGNIAFPTAWMDALPFFAAIQFHSAFAAGFGVNFLAANIHMPQERFQGSGLYSANGSKAFYYNKDDNMGKLLVSDMPVIDHPTVGKNSTSKPMSLSDREKQREFQAIIFNDNYNLVPLLEDSENVSVCHNNLCCHLSYSRMKNDKINELYALGAFDDLHTHDGSYYLQICLFVKCSGTTPSSCAGYTRESNTVFNNFQMYGNFSTPYVFPEILLSDNGSLHLSSSDKWSYKDGRLQSKQRLELPLLEAGLIGRIYERDGQETHDSVLKEALG